MLNPTLTAELTLQSSLASLETSRDAVVSRSYWLVKKQTSGTMYWLPA